MNGWMDGWMDVVREREADGAALGRGAKGLNCRNLTIQSSNTRPTVSTRTNLQAQECRISMIWKLAMPITAPLPAVFSHAPPPQIEYARSVNVRDNTCQGKGPMRGYVKGSSTI